jgi:phage gp36-like protein
LLFDVSRSSATKENDDGMMMFVAQKVEGRNSRKFYGILMFKVAM